MTLGQLGQLLRQQWFAPKRPVVLSGYQVLGQHPLTLADIALRNYVFAEAPAGDAFALAIAEGRRRCALEIITLAKTEPAMLAALIETKPVENRT